MTLLVAYGSKRGSTQEVAEAVAERAARRGREVDLRRAADVDDLTPYDGVVLGGSLYFGRWHEDASSVPVEVPRGAVGRSRGGLRARAPRLRESKDLADSRAQLDKALRKSPGGRAAPVAVFGGVIDPSKLRFPLNRMPASDARDWDAIDAWADELPASHERRGTQQASGGRRAGARRRQARAADRPRPDRSFEAVAEATRVAPATAARC